MLLQYKLNTIKSPLLHRLSIKKNSDSINKTQRGSFIQQGFSLIELMVTIAITAIMLTIAVPSLNDFIVKMRVDSEISELNRLVLTARNTAISTEQNVILCPLDGANCISDWSRELSVFIDVDNSLTYSAADDTLVKVKSAVTNGSKITYDAQSSIAFAPTGMLSTTESDFIYCPVSDTTLARAVVVASSGRTYKTADRNGDGKDQYRTGYTVNCI